MVIIHVITTFGMGGAETVAINLAIAQSAYHKVVVAAALKAPDEHQAISESNRHRLAAAGVDTYVLGRVSKLSLAFAPKNLVHLIRRIRPDAVHSHTDIPDFVVSIAARLHSFKVIRTIHNTALWPQRAALPYLVESAFGQDLIIPVGEDANKAYLSLRGRLGLRASPYVRVIPNGVNLSDTNIYSQPTSDLALSRNRLNFAFIGRLARQKGCDIFLEAVLHLPDNIMNVAGFYVIGDGDQRIELEQFAREKNLPIKFVGPVPNAHRMMSQFDCIVMPSRFEGFPLTALEAQISAVPVITANAPGLREVSPLSPKLQVPSEDPTALASAIVDFVANREKHKHDADKAASQISEKYSVARMAKEYEKAYTNYLT